jgi:hypothetical protein
MVVQTSETLEQEIHRLSLKYNQNPQLISKIIKCEGEMYDDNGSWWHKNQNGSIDAGPAQINSIHWKEMEKLNLSPYRWEDTVTFMFILIKRNGFSDYSASRYCWDK